MEALKITKIILMNYPQWYIKQTQHRESLTELLTYFPILAKEYS